MNEESLEESLKSHKAQLSEISSMIEHADSITKLELYDLEKDLKELVKVTEESLMSLKKEKLLSMVEGDTKNSVQTNGECSKNELIEEETEDDFVGTKCRVKHVQEYGGYQYHNSIVLSVHHDQSEQIKVVVLFLNPTQPSMIPCKYFLSGNCTFADSCKFSHGYEVDLNDLLEYEEPDFSLLSMGGKCLAKYDDGVWHKATVHEVHDEVATISYDGHADDTHQVDLHSLLPLPGYHSNSSSDAEDDQCDGEIGEVEQTSMKGPMADWEQYTKGIGSKLMMKMGYIFGKGLGKNGEGRTEPVEIRLLPPGKSLDYIAELREKGHIRDPTKNKAKKLPEKPTAQERTFALINNLTDRRAVNQQQSSSKKKTKFGVEESYKSMKRDLTRQKCGDVRKKETKHSTLNVEMLRNSEQLSKLKKKLAEQKKSLARNPGDTSVSRTIKHKISQTEKEIRLLEEDERRIEQKLNIKSQTKKLSIF